MLILWKKNCYLVYFLLKLRVRKLQLYEKWTPYLQVFFKDFVKNLSNATLDFKFPEHYLFFQSISKLLPLKVKIGVSKTSLLVSLSSAINICIVTKYGTENYGIRSQKSFLKASNLRRRAVSLSLTCKNVFEKTLKRTGFKLRKSN